jgi:hypothetical protein
LNRQDAKAQSRNKMTILLPDLPATLERLNL